LPNHRKPGVLLVGIADDGTPAGPEVVVTDALLQTLADIRPTEKSRRHPR
jgi:hypothetical protein